MAIYFAIRGILIRCENIDRAVSTLALPTVTLRFSRDISDVMLTCADPLGGGTGHHLLTPNKAAAEMRSSGGSVDNDQEQLRLSGAYAAGMTAMTSSADGSPRISPPPQPEPQKELMQAYPGQFSMEEC